MIFDELHPGRGGHILTIAEVTPNNGLLRESSQTALSSGLLGCPWYIASKWVISSN